MKTINHYEAPQVEVIEVSVEKGYAGSGDFGEDTEGISIDRNKVAWPD